jgi:hypothetical protein
MEREGGRKWGGLVGEKGRGRGSELRSGRGREMEMEMERERERERERVMGTLQAGAMWQRAWGPPGKQGTCRG